MKTYQFSYIILFICVYLLTQGCAIAQLKLPQKYYGSYTPLSHVYLSYGNIVLRSDTIEFPELPFKTTYTVIATSDSLPTVPISNGKLEVTRYLIRLRKVLPADQAGNHMFNRIMILALDEPGSLHIWGTNSDKISETKLLEEYSVWGLYEKE